MAAAGSSLAGADALRFLNTSEKPPDLRAVPKTWISWPLKSIKAKALNVLIASLYLTMIIITQMWGSWTAASERSISQASGTPRPATPLDSWSQYVIFSKVLDAGRANAPSKQFKSRARSMAPTTVYRGCTTFLCIILLLCGDIQVNPGPMDLQQPLQVAETALIYTPHAFNTAQMISGNIANSAHPRASTFINTLQQGNRLSLHAFKPANETGKLNAMQTLVVSKQRQMKLFQTVNHASVLWNPLTKPKGIFGGHINIRSVMSKTEQLEHLLLGSNLHYLCLSETWITATTPVSAFMIPGYKVYRRDRGKGKGGGVLIYVKDSIGSHQIDIPDQTIECVGVK